MSVLSIVVALVALQGAGPKGLQNQNGPAATSTVRFYDAAKSDKDTKLDIYLDNAPVATALSSDTMSGPFPPKNAKSVDVVVKDAGGSKVLLEKKVDMAGTDHVLVLTGDPDAKLDATDLAVAAVLPTDSQAHVNVLNASDDNVDVFVVKPDDKLDSAEPAAKGIAPKATGMAMVAPGNYKVEITKGDKTSIAASEAFDAKAADRLIALVIPGPEGQAPKVVVVAL